MIILALVIAFFVGMLGSTFPGLNLNEQIIPMSQDLRTFLDLLIYPIIVLLIIDLSLKYRKTKNPKTFVKKHWIDIFMLVLIPVFSIINTLN